MVEILSPSNKLSGAEGRASFLAKRDEVMNSSAHWVEIDLLRAGEQPAYRRQLGPHEYAAFASVVERRPHGRAWPIRLTQPLPVIGIPLRKGDGEAPLDLQAALAAVYARAALDLRVDYARPPDPPLPADLAKWADALLRKKKLR